ncbi:syndecan-like [Centruroides sculpturatus]|uniref:syndecan-like n=1 Tax=Centruroides sculpturatus TaxID=218467 RepID=UPI000C6ED78E|nr:syndecan-like [Centruroides sculpturatus]
MLYRLSSFLLLLAIWECAIIKINAEAKNGDMIFIDDPQGDQIEGSAIDDEFADLDHSNGRGVDDEDTPGSGFGPEDSESGSGGDIFVSPNDRKPSLPEGQPVTSTTTMMPTTQKTDGKDLQPPIKVPPPDDENRVPDTQDPVFPETSTKFNVGSSPSPNDNNERENDIFNMGHKQYSRSSSFFAQPGILAAVIGGAVVGLLCAILLVMFIVYRMRKKDEGSYALDEPKRSPTVNSYTRNTNKEFYA